MELLRDKNLIITILIVISGVLLVTVFYLLFATQPKEEKELISAEKVVKRGIDFINENFLRGNLEATLVGEIERVSGLYKFKLKIADNEYTSYISRDGKLLFPEAIDLTTELKKSTSQSKKKLTCEDLKKREFPKLEAFVVSYCPFGLQMERILAKIVKEIPSFSNYIKVRYLGEITGKEIQSMHGEKEAQENLTQICLREEQGAKFFDYLNCFIKEGKSEKCLKFAKVNQEKLSQCKKDSQRGLKYAKEDFELARKYQISGSPTLILNGERVNEFDFGGRTAQAVKEIICCGFKEKPKECAKTLTKESAVVGFSKSYSGTSKGQGSCE